MDNDLRRVHSSLLPKGGTLVLPWPDSPGSSTAQGGHAADPYVSRLSLQLGRGEALYRVGDPAPAPFLLRRGVLRVSVTTHSGRSRLADFAGPGDVVGTAAFDDAVQAETAVAADDALVELIDLDATLARKEGRAALAGALTRQMVRSRELTDDLGLPMGARISRIIARLALRLGEPCPAPAASRADGAGTSAWRRLPFSLTHDDVALLAGCARVTATRILGELRESGVLDGNRGDYLLIPAALERAADGYVYDVL